MAYDSNFEDELEQFDEIPVSEERIEFDGLQKAAAKAERRRKRRRTRNERTGKIAAAVILVCILTAIVLAVVFEKEVEEVLYQDSREVVSLSPTLSPTTRKPTIRTTSSPTLAPKPTYHVFTPSPTGPPPVPAPTTVSPAPTAVMRDTYTFEPVADTFLHLDGIHKGKIYGRQETLSVQRGNKASTLPGHEVTLPAIVSLIEFDTTQGITKPLPKRSRWPEAEDQVKVELQIHHIPKNSPMDNTDEMAVEDILPISLEIYRLPNNRDMIVESLTGEAFQEIPRSMREGILITQQTIGPTDTVLDIDVTSALFLPEGTTGYGDEEVLLMLKVYWEEESIARDLFASREADGKSPHLIFSNMLSEEL